MSRDSRRGLVRPDLPLLLGMNQRIGRAAIEWAGLFHDRALADRGVW
jgi:hypothetical protein